MTDDTDTSAPEYTASFASEANQELLNTFVREICASHRDISHDFQWLIVRKEATLDDVMGLLNRMRAIEYGEVAPEARSSWGRVHYMLDQAVRDLLLQGAVLPVKPVPAFPLDPIVVDMLNSLHDHPLYDLALDVWVEYGIMPSDTRVMFDAGRAISRMAGHASDPQVRRKARVVMRHATAACQQAATGRFVAPSDHEVSD